MRLYSALLAVTGLALTAACDVDQTQEARAPDVDVNASGGQLPEYDVDAKEVDVGTRQSNVAVPDVDVNTEQRTVEVPTVQVQE